MICAADFTERAILVGHNPLEVFITTNEQLAAVKQKPDGHYERNDMLRLANGGDARHYDEEALLDIFRALPILIGGCPPRVHPE
jgi:hypothetical protein